MNSSSIIASARTAICIALLALTSSGCYLLQAAHGQLAVMAQRRPIATVIANPATQSRVREQLTTVNAIRDFATRELKLPDNGSYRKYADIRRPYVVWNVFAAPPFSLEPRQWCYPIAGCVAYRGYFSEKKAAAFAAKLRAQGYDVATGGVAAYSTLGHFDDPILSSMLGWSDVQLASIVFHELTHQLLYVPNDSAFNEALATLVEEEGVRRWLVFQGRQKDLAGYERQQERYLQVVDLLIRSRTQLQAVYRTALAPEAMRAEKQAAFAQLRQDFQRLSAPWGPHAPFESWFAQDINNAHLVSVATYHRCVPGFARELARVNGELPRFYARARQIAALPATQRQQLLCSGA